jgi:GAF domain-containing protein
MSTGAETEYEYRVRAKDGSVIWLHDRGHLVTDSAGKRIWQGVMLDITEHKRAEAERQAITEIVHGVITTSSLDELFSLAHQSISKLLPAENCFVALHDKTSDLLHIPFFKDEFDPIPAPQRVGRGLTAFVLRSRRPMLLSPEFIQELAVKGEIELVGTLPAAWLGVPLRTSTDTIGVLVVQHYEDKDAYSQQDLELLAAVADQLGLAIERKQIEMELKKNEMQMSEAQGIAHVGSWEFDVVTDGVKWSHELWRIFGLEPRESGLSFEEYLAMVHAGRLEAPIRTSLSSSESKTI